MRKAASFSRWSLLMGVACGLAMLPVANRAARAEMISISIDANGTTIPVDLAHSHWCPTSQNYGTVDLTTLNSLLGLAGSVYQFAIGGSSNYPGFAYGWKPATERRDLHSRGGHWEHDV